MTTEVQTTSRLAGENIGMATNISNRQTKLEISGNSSLCASLSIHRGHSCQHDKVVSCLSRVIFIGCPATDQHFGIAMASLAVFNVKIFGVYGSTRLSVTPSLQSCPRNRQACHFSFGSERAWRLKYNLETHPSCLFDSLSESNCRCVRIRTFPHLSRDALNLSTRRQGGGSEPRTVTVNP
ncbi:hypothetical protein SCLCIDRAFT_631197 [Scleroderma citrinum Foug A]|uniref:Uncharacterized protein n=1 Tax=Scleroderma citrinum Foug A TaxID=1036808 RepID=A0A0C3DUZ2_9AGAM|nr:hypothetical protein SCLCIDRAFT_631197 [Scleroderma citrinum Foug A]